MGATPPLPLGSLAHDVMKAMGQDPQTPGSGRVASVWRVKGTPALRHRRTPAGAS